MFSNFLNPKKNGKNGTFSIKDKLSFVVIVEPFEKSNIGHPVYVVMWTTDPLPYPHGLWMTPNDHAHAYGRAINRMRVIFRVICAI